MAKKTARSRMLGASRQSFNFKLQSSTTRGQINVISSKAGGYLVCRSTLLMKKSVVTQGEP